MKKYLLKSQFLPMPSENRMKNEGDVISARKHYINKRPNNLEALLEQRFSWMNHYVCDANKIIEIGSGAGFSKFFIRNKNLKLTDYKSDGDWIDLSVDALNMPFPNNSLDAIISSHMVHHLANPLVFFNEMRRCLKPNGVLVIQEINTSLLMRILLRIMRHEGYSYDIDVFSPNVVANRPDDPWSANCAVPEMLFSNNFQFESKIRGFKIIKNQLSECLLFPLSGGVISKTFTINLPKPMLGILKVLDTFLVYIFPQIFALGRSVVLKKYE